MRIAALSDIHSNMPALEAVLADIAKLGPDVQIVVAGDMLNCGAFPRETLALLRALPNALIIAGNHEEYVLEKLNDAHSVPPYRALFAPSTWTYNQLTGEEVKWLQNLPRQLELTGPAGSDVQIVHGSPRYQTEGLFGHLAQARLADIFKGQIASKRLWISGHTHRPMAIRWQGMTITNCGSVGAPFDGDLRACYLLAEWDKTRQNWRTQHRRVQYDRERVLAAMWENTAYDQGGPFMRLMWHNLKTGRDVSGVSQFVRAYIGLGEYPAPPDDFLHLDQAIERHLAKLT